MSTGKFGRVFTSIELFLSDNAMQEINAAMPVPRYSD